MKHLLTSNQIGEEPAEKLLLSFPSPEQVMETAGFRMPPQVRPSICPVGRTAKGAFNMRGAGVRADAAHGALASTPRSCSGWMTICSDSAASSLA